MASDSLISVREWLPIRTLISEWLTNLTLISEWEAIRVRLLANQSLFEGSLSDY